MLQGSGTYWRWWLGKIVGLWHSDFHSFANSCSSFISCIATSILSLPHIPHSFLVQRLLFFRYLVFFTHFWQSDFHSFATSCSSFISVSTTSILSQPHIPHSFLVQRLPFFRYLVFFTHYWYSDFPNSFAWFYNPGQTSSRHSLVYPFTLILSLLVHINLL